MIELKNVTKIFEIGQNENITAVKNISLHVKEGEVVVLKGPSGSGKSTILSMIAALSKPTSGEVIVAGKRISKLADNFTAIFRRENIGFIFQKYNLILTLSAKDNAIVPLIPSNLPTSQLNERVDRLFEQLSISKKRDVITKNLSGGEQQRVAIARALINDPRIIIADEPTANLDKKLSEEFIEIIRTLKDGKNTIIISTHDPLFFDLDFIDYDIEIRNGELMNASNS
jgi:putative ABC transport system ATP-binding protein